VTAGSIARFLHAALPRLSFRAQAVLDGLLLTGGALGTAQELAPHLGMRSRFQLARFLRQEGLPPLHDLAGWACVLDWLERAEKSGYSLCQLAFRSKKDPAACYRTVKRITGRSWGELKRRGSRRLVVDFRERCRRAGALNCHSGPTRPF